MNLTNTMTRTPVTKKAYQVANWPSNSYKKNRAKLHALIISTMLFIAYPSKSLAQSQDCLALAEDDWDKLYCTIKSKTLTQLPPQYEFQRNTIRVKALLLKRHAQALKLTMPTVQTNNNNTMPLKHGTPTPDKNPATQWQASTLSTENNDALPVQKSNPLEYCQLAPDTILCHQQSFKLAHNQMNSTLVSDVFSTKNTLNLFMPKTNPSSKQLLDNYQHYIEKMLKLGLGASTMSLTKFHATYQTSIKKRFAFNQRMAEMYEHLKRDKANLGIKARYQMNTPSNLQMCDQLSPSLIVCDNVKQNWIYQKQ